MNPFMTREGRFLGLDDAQADPKRAAVAVLPIPFERTSTYGAGSATGPAAILHASHQLELYDSELGFEPWRAASGIVTRWPPGVPDYAGGRELADRVDGIVQDWLDRSVKVVTLAGEHTGVVGAIRAYARHYDDLTVLQLDAHSDLREEYQNDAWNHACTTARVLDFHRRITQVGIRSEALEERRRAEELDMPVFRGETIQGYHEHGIDWTHLVIAACSRRVYVTIDCDVFDPSVVPATGTPEPGGLTWGQVNRLLARLCSERQVVGFDVSELAPVGDLRYPEFAMAKLVSRLIGYMFRSSSGTGPYSPGHRLQIRGH